MARQDIAGRGGTVVRGGVFAPNVPAVSLLILNLLDGLFTLLFLQLDLAWEANPLMRAAYEAHPLGFMAIKLLIVNAGVLVLCLYRTARLAQFALRFAVFVYAVILVWHLAFLTHVLTR